MRSRYSKVHSLKIFVLGIFPDWQRQLSKFASVQDRLREWKPDVLARIAHFACITIAMLDIDGFRIDKATQITVDALGDWSDSVRQCARRYGKENFFIPGEITGGNSFGSIYLGLGREQRMLPSTIQEAFALSNKSDDKYFIREKGKNALDAGAFHYTVYRALTRFLFMDGQLSAGFDAPLNWADMWYTIALSNDFVNANTGRLDPRHMYGVTNQDVFRWPAIKDGEHKMMLGLFITTLLMPGIPKVNCPPSNSLRQSLTRHVAPVGRGTVNVCPRQHRKQLYLRATSHVFCSVLAESWLLQSQFNPILQLSTR